MEEENKGISISGIFRTIGVQKWLALIVAVVITLALALAIQFGYNRAISSYVTEFTLILPGGYTGNSVYTYPDGTTFYYANMTSYSSLYSIKNSKDEFSPIDVDRMVDKGDISIERVVQTSENYTEISFKISAASKYFYDGNTAKKFLRAVATAPADYVKTMHMDCDVFLTLSKSAEDYVSQIDLLNSQLEYLLTEYEKLVENYGGNFVVDGRTLSSYYNEITAYSGNDKLNVLLTKVTEEAILKSEESRANYQMSKANLMRQLTVAESTLENLKSAQTSGGVTTGSDTSVLKIQSDLVAKLNQQIIDAGNFYENGVVDKDGKFEKDYIAAEYEKIEQFTNIYERVVTVAYDKTSTVSFSKVNIVSLEGNWSMTKSVVISLAAGVVIALIVGYIAGYITLKKRDEKPEVKTAE